MASIIKVDTIKDTSDNTLLTSSSGNVSISNDLVVDTNTLYVDSTNNVVGVGTSSPSDSVGFGSAIDIQSSNGGGVYFRDSDSPSTATYIGYIGSNSSAYVWNQDNGPILFGTNDTERMRIDSSGNLKFNSGYGSVATAYGCRAWVNFDGSGTPSIRDSGNVSSITDNGTGDFTVNFTTAMPDANYCALATTGRGQNTTTGRTVHIHGTAPTTSSVRFKVRLSDDTAFDDDYIMVAIIR